MDFFSLEKDFALVSDSQKAIFLLRFFKTGKGQYGEGDVFLGITVPESWKIAKKYKALGFLELQKLLNSKFHEYRLVALMILVLQFARADEAKREKIVKFYLKNSKRVNNWDLVDLSAHKILGEYLLGKDWGILVRLAHSGNIWERRIAMVSSFAFIQKKELKVPVQIAEILINDKHDLIQKAVGWMLREVGKKDQNVEERFLKKHYKTMPRTALRYAIERFDSQKRLFYMKG